MRVLVACECSGVVRDAFCRLGHDAWSCDLQRGRGYYFWKHHEGDVREVLYDKWDLVIAHPPCTHLAASGAGSFKYKETMQWRARKFVEEIWDSPAKRMAIENPIGVLSTQWMPYSQIIQPYQFGHPESKATCLWLRNLPLLEHTDIVEPQWKKNPDGTDWKSSKGKRMSVTHYGNSKDRSNIRAKTYEGIALAMADQWGFLGPYPF